jgi:hypothetical protein
MRDHANKIRAEHAKKTATATLASVMVKAALLDIAGAYDNVSHERLISNIKKLGLGQLAPWITSFLTNRSTRIKLPGYLSEAFPTPTGIPQGSPISPILFLLFNAPLIRACCFERGDGRTEGFGWVDDAAIMAVSDSYYTNVQLLQRALGKADLWARQHAAKFAPDKFELIHFKNPRSDNDQANINNATEIPSDVDPYDYGANHPQGHDQMPVQVPGGLQLQPSEYAKYLGIWLDKGLSFEKHRNYAIAKASGSLEALRGVTGSTWGISLHGMRRVYQAVVIPQMLYGLSAWYCPATGMIPAPQRNRMVKALERIQERAAIVISGAFRGVARDALDVELFLQPIRLQMQQSIEEHTWVCLAMR